MRRLIAGGKHMRSQQSADPVRRYTTTRQRGDIVSERILYYAA
jgi:hypothetical protein